MNYINQKKILIVIPSFEVGGTIVSLNSLLSVIDSKVVSVDIFPLKASGAYKGKLPNSRTVSENIWLSNRIVDGNIIWKTLWFFVYTTKYVFKKTRINILPFFSKIGSKQLRTTDYDVIISYVESISPIVATYPAKKHIAWIHSDYSRYMKLSGINDESKIYDVFDKIVCVSKFAKSVFADIYPKYKDKVEVIYNVINVEDIKAKSLQNEVLDKKFDTSSYTIVSAGRLDPVKQFELIPSIADKVRTLTTKPFKWYIIGGSRGFEALEQRIKDDIKKRNLVDYIFLLSEKNNIYPYFAKSDLYVSTSFSESYPLVINEAKALGVPIIANDFPSAKESINDGIDGFIVPIEYMAEKIAQLLENKHQTTYAIYDNRDNTANILEQLYSII